jgi:F-type H+-transporting ATPase subunit b
VDLNATFFGQTIAMFVFVWFCMKFVWPPIIAMIEERQTQIADGLAAAEKGARSLEEAQSQVAKAVEEARVQARQIIDQANQRANGIVEEARTGATQERDRILATARAEVEQEINRARDELRGQVAAIAVAGAEKILSREIDAAAHRELLERLAAEI